MAPGKITSIRGGSLSPPPPASQSRGTHETSVIKVGGELYDRDGYRMDVRVWFRHRNEVLFYLDSGGSVHGPMDQKHSMRLGRISRSGSHVHGSRHYLQESTLSRRRQSDFGMEEQRRAESPPRLRTMSESFHHQHSRQVSRSSPPPPYGGRRVTSTLYVNQTSSPPSIIGIGDDGDGEDSTRYYRDDRQDHHRHYYKSIANHDIVSSSGSPRIARWSSTQNNARYRTGSASNRYATTMTRQHIKRYHNPVEMLVKHPGQSHGASRIDLVSVDNRQRSLSPQPIPVQRPLTITTHHDSSRERQLESELAYTRRELQDLRRSQSLTGEQHFVGSPELTRHKSTSVQYLDSPSWTTHVLSK